MADDLMSAIDRAIHQIYLCYFPVQMEDTVVHSLFVHMDVALLLTFEVEMLTLLNKIILLVH